AVSRSDRCSPHRSLRISRVLRMDTRSAGIVPSSSPLWDVEGVPVAVPRREAPAGPGGGQPAGCSAWLGITVRIRSERVFGFPRNRCSASIGTPARLRSESAVNYVEEGELAARCRHPCLPSIHLDRGWLAKLRAPRGGPASCASS